MACVIVSGIYMAAQLPQRAPLGLPVGMLAAAAVLLAAAAALVSSLRPLVFALDIPVLLGFSIARYQDPAAG